MKNMLSRRLSVEVLLAAALAFAASAAAVADVPDYDFDWAVIGDVGNPPYEGVPGGDLAGRGTVNYNYRIARLPITSAQWLEFVNIFAPQSDNPGWFLKPTFSGLESVPGQPGIYQLNPWIENAGMLPVLGVSWRDAAMYCNWLHNDKSTEWEAIMDGAYDASTFGNGPFSTFTDQLTRSPGAKFFIPTLDEWIKAAHYDPNHGGPGVSGWWEYPNSSDEPLIPGLPDKGETCAGIPYPGFPQTWIPLGSYPEVESPWGLMDVSCGVAEWTEEVFYGYDDLPTDRGLKGSFAASYPKEAYWFDKVYIVQAGNPQGYGAWDGLRIASAVSSCAADLTGDGEVGVADLLVLLAAWGPCPVGRCCITDFDGDQVTNVADLVFLLSHWGSCSK